jgi:hypothetical protein
MIGGTSAWQYLLSGICQTYALHQGCYEYGTDVTCSGYFSVLGALPPPSSTPSMVPSGPSASPSTVSPSANSPSPSSASSVICAPYSATADTTVPCLFRACAGTPISIILSTSTGYIRLYLYDANGFLVSSSYGGFSYTTAVTSSCQTYTLQQGCFSTCTGSVSVIGGFYSIPSIISKRKAHLFYSGNPLPTTLPSLRPSGPSTSPVFPTIKPSTTPSMNPTFASSIDCDRFTTTGNAIAPTCTFYACPGLTVPLQPFFSVQPYNLQERLSRCKL